ELKGANIKKNLATVIVTSPDEIVTTSGVIAHIATLLTMESINVVEMMSSHTETSFIVEEWDALKAVEVIRKEIKRARVIGK
ncbi:MAG: ACT domain-containing protein, partial [Candidatus Hydrothermarchaeota archaeon]|nr:ACT domain-containing protein [Candidatus Hydrothermarchaeota archaeon]